MSHLRQDISHFRTSKPCKCVCGENGSESCVPTPFSDVSQISCEEDVLRWLFGQLDYSKEFHLCISRHNLLERGIKQWQCQKKASPLNPIKVTFICEAGVDTGALRLEFLTEMVAGLEERLFERGGQGKIPKYSMSDLDKGLFRVAGQVFVASLAQGGPAPKFLQEWCFTFLATGTLQHIRKDEVPEPQRSLIKESHCVTCNNAACPYA